MTSDGWRSKCRDFELAPADVGRPILLDPARDSVNPDGSMLKFPWLEVLIEFVAW